MNLLLDSFWRAAAYCLRPGIIFLSFLPLLLISALAVGWGYFFWDDSLQWVRSALESNAYLNMLWDWLDQSGFGRLKTIVVPLLVIFAVTPVIVLLCLLVVGVLMTPAMVRLVAARRFPALEVRQGAGFWVSLAWSLGATLAAVLALLVSLPFWLIPPLVLVLPPLIWGWLAYRVMAFDALSIHASSEERRDIFKLHRPWLLGMGILTGYMGAAPSVVWASGAFFAAGFVILVPLAVWLYTLVFAFASLWFSHYCLAALVELRSKEQRSTVDAEPTPVAPSVVPPTVPGLQGLPEIAQR